MEIKKRKLMTWEKFEKEFKSKCSKWDKNSSGSYSIIYENKNWYINYVMVCNFGGFISVVEEDYIECNSYTHSGMGCNWHELWFEPEFEPIEFLKEEEMIL